MCDTAIPSATLKRGGFYSRAASLRSARIACLTMIRMKFERSRLVRWASIHRVSSSEKRTETTCGLPPDTDGGLAIAIQYTK